MAKRPTSAAGSHPQPRLFGAGLPPRTRDKRYAALDRPKRPTGPVISLRRLAPCRPEVRVGSTRTVPFVNDLYYLDRSTSVASQWLTEFSR